MFTVIFCRSMWLRVGFLICLLMVSVACTAPVAQLTPTQPPQPPPTQTVPGATPSPGCVFDMRQEADSLLDPPLVEADAQLPYEWTLRNSGSCAWPAAAHIVHESGSTFGVLAPLQIGSVPVGDAVVVPLQLTAAADAGTFIGLWRLVDGDGTPIGGQLPITLRIAVATPVPTVTQPSLTATMPPPVATGTPTAQPPPTGTPPTPPAGMPVVNSFTANVSSADPGDAILLTWTTTNANAATLWYLMPTGQLGEFWEVEPNGAFTYDIHEWQRNGVTFMIYARDASDAFASASLTIPLRCTGDWFFANPPTICPFDPPLPSAAAEQQFERGTMLWIGAQDRIVVLYDDGQSYAYDNFSDDWDPGEAESDPALVPPPGLYQPVRGFGLVWRAANDGRVHERLGWAVGQEAGYETLLQTTSYAKYNHTYILARDGQVWHLLAERSAWEKIPR